MAMRWEPSPELREIVEFVDSHGISRLLLRSRLLQIALSDQNMAVSLKAVEVLLSMGSSETDEQGAGEPMSFEQAKVVHQLTEAFINGDDDLTTILGDVATSGPESPKASDLTARLDLNQGIGETDVSSLPVRPPQSFDNGRAFTRGDGENQETDY